MVLENINLKLQKKSKWEFTGYDLRPTDGTDTIKGKMYGIYADYTKNLRIENFSLDVDPSMNDVYGGKQFEGKHVL